jgi:hypothetical protein
MLDISVPKRPSVGPAKPRSDGRKSLLVYLDKELIKRLKVASLDEERHVYEIMEEAVRGYLAEKASRKKRPS